MDNYLKRVFINEVNNQCRFAIFAFNNIRISSTNLKLELINNYIPFYYIHSFLTHTGNLSKILWPNPNDEKLQSRGEVLRQELNIIEDLYIKNRKFRNHIEHYDERIDRWAESSERRNFADMNIMSSLNVILGIDPKDFFRTFNPEEMIFYFNHDEYHLVQAVKEIEDTYDKSKEWLRRNF